MTTTTTEHEAPPEAKHIDPVQAAAEEGFDASKEVALVSGSLTLSPTQKEMTAVQRASLAAIGVDTQNDPGVLPHLRAFFHMCQIRGLDPWAREAYLVGRGRGSGRKWTMQTGIDGYRKMGAATGRFIRVKKRLWTGRDGDPSSYVQVTDEDGDVVMKRRWYDQWPEEHGNPGAAKVVIEHLDENGHVTTTAAVADWAMFAPYNDVYEGPQGNRRKVTDSDGKPVKELSEMWARGGPHMLAKCLPGHTRIQTDRGSLFIKDIVNQRLDVKVRSVDLDTGEECWQPVVNWWRNGVTRDWVMVRTPNGSRGNRALRTTPDHPFLTPLGWKAAGDLTTADMVAVTSPTLSAEQEQVLRGSMLGDGALISRKRDSSLPYFSESHSIKQADYLRWKADALANLSPTVTEEQRADGAGGSHPTIRMRTRAVPALYGWRRKPTEWLDGLDDLGLAVWFMDDGSIGAGNRQGRRPYARIHCCGFSLEFADAAVEWFATRGITCKVMRREKNPYLEFGVEATAVLLERLAPYVGRDGNRKVWHAAPIAERGLAKGFAFVPVLAAEAITKAKGEQRYDIEVEGTHNFVVNNVVVHNCAEALAYRMAFPAKMSGFYITEEMHQADQNERERRANEQNAKRMEAYRAAQAAQAQQEGSSDDEGDVVDADLVEEPQEPAEQPQEPVPVSETAQEVAETLQRPEEPAATPQDDEAPEEVVHDWLMAELALQAAAIGKTPAALATRRIKMLQKNLEDFTTDELLTTVAAHRLLVANVNRRDDLSPEVARYLDLIGDPSMDLNAETPTPINPEEWTA